MAECGTVGIIGAGTMGAGIAQVAATSGWTVELMDVDEETVRQAIARSHSGWSASSRRDGSALRSRSRS